MSNCVFGFPEHSAASPLFTPVVDNPVRFVSTLPGSNVLHPKLSRLARTLDATTTNTQVLVNLGVSRSIGLLTALIPNLTKTSTPTVQWVGYTDAAYTTPGYDSGALQAWPTGVTAEDVMQPDGSSMNVWSTHLPPSGQNYRYWGCFVVDTANADGHVDFARIILAGAYRPSVCMQTGAKSQLENNTVETETDGGACLYQVKRNRRTDVFTLPNVGRQESLESIRRMEQRLGKSGQTFFVWDETDTYKYERAYLATLRSLGALEYNLDALHSTVAYEVAEVL